MKTHPFLRLLIILSASIISCNATSTSDPPIVEKDAHLLDYKRLPINSDELISAVNKIKVLFKNNDVHLIAKAVKFPLARKLPIPEIANIQEFIADYENLISKELLKDIEKSQIQDWEYIPSKGIILVQTSNHDETIMISENGEIIAIHSTTPQEERKRTRIIEQDKISLHSQYRDFNTAKYVVISSKYKYRIDLMPDNSYRLITWNNPNAVMLSNPDLVLSEGKTLHEKHSSDPIFEFNYNRYSYRVHITPNSSSTENSLLTIAENGKDIFKENGTIIWGK